MTTGQQLIAQGRAEGAAEVLSSMLESRFGPLDEPARARIGSADAEQIMQWCNRVAQGADSVADVLR